MFLLWLVLVAILAFFFFLRKKVDQNVSRAAANSSSALSSGFVAIPDRYHTLSEVQGIDYTKSNESSGRKVFGRCMHDIIANKPNPYQQVIEILGRTLEAFDDDKLIPTYGFGDSTTGDKRVFPFFPDRPCHTFKEVLSRYTEITPHLTLSGPTNFAPLIYEAINIVKETKAYHILVIVADGQVTNEQATRNAIVAAAAYPLSIVVVGVGDGPWDLMQEFDDKLPQRKFDNFQFVDYHSVTKGARNAEFAEVAFAVNALMEIPDQFLAIRRLGYL